MLVALSFFALAVIPRVFGHASFWHPSMFGFNVTQQTFPYDNRPVAPIKNMNFSQWWFHNHLAFPPNDGDVFELPAGQPATAELACNKGATSFFASSEGGDIRNASNPDDVCPGSPSTEYHTQGLNDLEGCALAIAYKNNVTDVQPEDFTVFSVNQTCVWTRRTDFQVPERMPSCPEGGCICAFFWIHSPLSGGEENYMNGFKCNVTGSTSNVAIAESKVARRCGADPPNKKLMSVPGNCTYGAKTPFYWFNNERNNVFEGAHSPPVYNDLYNFLDGAQNDIFNDSYVSIPSPAPNAPLPVLADISVKQAIVPPAATPTPSGPAASATAACRAHTNSNANATFTVISLPTATVFGSIANDTDDPRASIFETLPAPSPTTAASSSASAASETAAYGPDSGYYRKRDMSNAHQNANMRRKLTAMRVNVESRRIHLAKRSRFW